MRVLQGVRVLDFSGLLPGPLATLLLAEAGAEVIKIEKPTGDEMRGYTPRVGSVSVNFPQLNRGKRSIAIDLKADGALASLAPLIESADVIVDQFRPGAMARLGLGYEDVRRINPSIIYCSITGYGQTGPKSDVAAHDLNYVGDAGLLSLVASRDGSPPLPPALIADIAGGAYPAVMNILLALLQRDRTGDGCFLDISMSDNVLTFLYWALAEGVGAGEWPKPGSRLTTGGSPRYNIYRTSDNRFIAAAPIEERFWTLFCDLIGLDREYRCIDADPQATISAVADAIAQRTAQAWTEVFAAADVCCSVVRTVEEAMEDPHFLARGLFNRRVATEEGSMVAVPVPISDIFRSQEELDRYPELGEHNEQLLVE
ncbi:CoA transferase [Phenylobacterium sp.]|jgi:crotonobetainyl-CoA:carnitine CoA-transferase CaiB-like acyl-CoA transferase|uniref:CaiB/BaiF CoA transferase family protein n=1 Tax=Phenylobacterium sp. TaxID=1871053 RepID=UPI002E340CA3|nr:CoA transferase [Phenylobacterium sp.]HEX3364625.1 CoA transferase [Phenylobacterium sp.]